MDQNDIDIANFPKKDLYIVILSYKNKGTLDVLLEEIRDRFKPIRFSVRSCLGKENEWQLRLDGNDSEIRPRAFAEGFIAACERITKDIKEKEKTNES